MSTLTREQEWLGRFIEGVFCVFALILMAGAMKLLYVDYLDYDTMLERDLSRGNTLFQLISTSIYTLAAVLLLERRDEAWRLLRENGPLLALVGLTVVSAMWSVLPGVSFRRAIALALTTLFAFYLAARFSPADLLRLLGWTFLLIAVASVAAGAALPSIGRHADPIHHGVWRGVLSHKNEAGRVMALAVLTFWFLRHDRGVWRWLAWVGMAASLVMLAMTQSRTSWLAVALVFAALPFLELVRSRAMALGDRLFALTAVLLAAVFLVGLSVAPLLQLMGDDFTLHGRTSLWKAAFAVGMEHPWLGAGYRAFWTEAGAAAVFARMDHWAGVVGNGHSGYFDIWLEMGVVGVALFLVTTASTVHRAFAQLVRTGSRPNGWYLALALFLLVYSLTEKVILQQSEIVWLLFTTNLLYLGRQYRPAPVAAPLQVPSTALRPMEAQP